jgi:hypothetical protein
MDCAYNAPPASEVRVQWLKLDSVREIVPIYCTKRAPPELLPEHCANEHSLTNNNEESYGTETGNLMQIAPPESPSVEVHEQFVNVCAPMIT